MVIKSGQYTFDSSQYPGMLGDGGRSFSHFVKFDTHFTSDPQASVAVSRLDIGNSANTRVNVYATDTVHDGINITLEVWADTKAYSVGVAWLAYADS